MKLKPLGCTIAYFYRLSVRGFAYILSFRPHTSVYYTDEEAGPQQVKSCDQELLEPGLEPVVGTKNWALSIPQLFL